MNSKILLVIAGGIIFITRIFLPGPANAAWQSPLHHNNFFQICSDISTGSTHSYVGWLSHHPVGVWILAVVVMFMVGYAVQQISSYSARQGPR